MPARPPLSRPVGGEVVGFAPGWEGQRDGVLWISGDKEGRAAAERAFAAAPAQVRDTVRGLIPGVPRTYDGHLIP